MSDPPLSLGGSERNQHLKINYRRFKTNALFCYQLFQRCPFTVEYIQVENSTQTETESCALVCSQYVFQNNRVFSIIKHDYARKKSNEENTTNFRYHLLFLF